MKVKTYPIFIIILLLCFLSGCSMTMTSEERIGLLYSGQSIENVQNQNVIQAPENNEATRVVLKHQAYDWNTVGEVLLNLTPEEVQAKKESETTLYTYRAEKMIQPMDDCGIRSYPDYFLFNAIPDVDVYDAITTLVEVPSIKEIDGVSRTYSDARLSQLFPKEELDGMSISEAQEICDDVLTRIGFSVGDSCGYVLDQDSLNANQKKILDQRESYIPSPGYARDEKGNAIEQEVGSWKKEDEAFVFFYTPSYRGIAIEGLGSSTQTEIYYSQKRGVFYIKSRFFRFEELPVQEETVTLLPGEDVLMMASADLNKIGVSADQVTDVSVVYYADGSASDPETNQVTLAPTWRVTYSQTIDGKDYTDSIFLDGVTGKLKSNES